MVDGVLLLVDAVEGPMPQTIFVTRKALALGLKPIVVVNKVDRPGARTDFVINATFDLFDKLGATDEQLDFPVVYASGLSGYAGLTPMCAKATCARCSTPSCSTCRSATTIPTPLQMQIISLDYSSYVGKIGVGRINRGRMRPGMEIAYKFGPEGQGGRSRINQVLKFHGLERVVVDEAEAGDIVLINGIEEIGIGSTVMDPVAQEPLPMLRIDEPTLTMNFMVNTSPLAGREGKFVTSRQLRDRLDRELKSNVALRVRDTGDDTVFEVSGRGELHLTILLETMRREGYELAVSRPRVVFKEIDGVKCEPFESLTIDVEDAHQGGVMEETGPPQGRPAGHAAGRPWPHPPGIPDPGPWPDRLQNEFLTLTRGTGLMSHIFHEYAPIKEGSIGERRNGVLISQDNGDAVAYALWKLQDRGRMFVNRAKRCTKA